MLTLLAAIAPVVLLLLLGAGLRASGIIDEAGRQTCGRLIYRVGIPSLLIAKLSSRPIDQGLDLAAVAAGAVVAGVVFVAVMMATRGVAAPRRGAIAAGCTRFNGAFVGLPVIAMLAAVDPSRGDELVTIYLLHLSLLVVPAHLTAVIGTVAPLQGWDMAGWRRVGIELLRNPVLQAAAAGLALAAFAPGLFQPDDARHPLAIVGRCLDLLGTMAVPLALLVTGAALRLDQLRSAPLQLGAVALVRLGVYPLLVLLLCRAFGAGDTATLAVLVVAGCPIAVGAVPVARELGADETFMAAAVVVTTVIAPLSLFGWLLIAA